MNILKIPTAAILTMIMNILKIPTASIISYGRGWNFEDIHDHG